VTSHRQLLEEKAMLLEALSKRRGSDPLYLWDPHTKQRQFINSVLGSDFYENWAFWANRAGKSDAGAYCGAKLARFGLDNPRPAIGPSATVWDRATSGWVVSLDFPSSRDIIQPKYFDNGFVPAGSTHAPFIPEHELEGGTVEKGWSVSNQILRLKNGSIVGFKSADSGRKKFQGTEKDWVHFDEEPPRDVYTECTIRVGAGRRLRVFGTCTLLPPEGQIGGVTWAYTEIVQPFQKNQSPTVMVWEASIYDNPHIPREEIARLESKYPEGSTERRIRLNGELLPGLAGSRAYTAFQHSLHVRDLGAPERRRPLCWTLDFNVEPMVSLVGQRIGRLFRVHREIVFQEGNVPDMADHFRELYPTHGAEVWVFGDATGKGRDAQTGKSDYQLILNTLRGYPVPLRLKVPDSNPNVPDRINAVNRALRDETGAVGVEIDPSCTELIADLEGVLRDPRGGLKKTYNPRDVYFRRTHTSDALGYWINFLQPVTSEPIRQGLQSPQSTAPVTIKQPSYGKRR
jgi:phage terminase large subunit-like protein